MKVGYARVSTLDQNLDRQIEVLQNKYGVDKLYTDKISGKDTDREQFQIMMQELKEGDTLIVKELSRIGRSLRDLLNIIDSLDKKHIKLIIDKENIDTESASGRMMFHISAAFAEYERAIMLERQREGIAIAKREGKYKGRPPVERDQDNIRMVCEAHIAGKMPVDKAAASILNLNVTDKKTGQKTTTVGVTIPTFYKIFRQYMIENNIKKVGYQHLNNNVEFTDSEEDQ